MTDFVVATPGALLIVRAAEGGPAEVQLGGKAPETVAVDHGHPARIYVGTHGHGLWRSGDGGRSWGAIGADLPHEVITAVAVAQGEGPEPGVVYAGSEPSTLARSDDGGQSWRQLPALLELPSSSRWSFPPKPHTHHVRWIETDPHAPDTLYVAIEAGALVRSFDGGESWLDRQPEGPIDTHQAATHPQAEGRLYSAAGDGYFESVDGGENWRRPMRGLQHRYLVGVAVDPGDPGTVVVSAARGPYLAYNPRNAEALLYRKLAGGSFELAMEGLPEAPGTVASRLQTHPEEPGVFYAVNNHGLFRSSDAGANWEPLEVDWPDGAFDRGVSALAVFEP